jgi:GNAT superfamily N-acetyltransferase
MRFSMDKSNPPSNIQVRLATVDEAAHVASVLHEAFVEYKSLYTPEAFTATILTADRIRERWSEGPVWVAQLDDRLVGTVAAVLEDDSLYIRSMAVLPNDRGKGVGRLLLEHVERFAATKGARRMLLCTTPFLLQAIRLYEQYGFQRISDGPLELFGTPLFTMKRILKP